MSVSKERLAEINAMPDDQIDTSDIPELDDGFFEAARLVLPDGTTKKAVTMGPWNDPALDDCRTGSSGAIQSELRRSE